MSEWCRDSSAVMDGDLGSLHEANRLGLEFGPHGNEAHAASG